MGYGHTSADDLSARAAYRKSSGTTFAYDATMRATAHDKRTVDEKLDPKLVNSRGERIRECLDSVDHPESLGVVVGFDQTGSMGSGPRIIREKLASLKGGMLGVGLPDVQLLFSCYGDAQNNEAAPCQVGQFESDDRMEEWLNRFFLEGYGGSNHGETSGLLLYFLATHSRLDSLTKRGQKGLIFLIGDEVPLMVTKQEVERYLGEDIQADIPMEEVVRMVQESYDVYFLLVNTGAAVAQNSLEVWSKLLGSDHVVVTQSLDTISELVAMMTARLIGDVDSVDDVGSVLVKYGADSSHVRSASTALARFDSRVGRKSVVVKADGRLNRGKSSTGATRL